MFTVGPDEISSIENLSDSDLQGLVEKLLTFASSMDSEHEKLEFKEKLNITNKRNKHEIRKDFSSFANTHGGLIIVGIQEKNKTWEIKGVDLENYPSDEDIRQILSSSTRIRPPVRYCWKPISLENNKKIVVYQIRESDLPVEVYVSGTDSWEVYRRYGSITRTMSAEEKIQKWYRGVKRLPSHFQVDTSSLGSYSPEGAKKSSSITWAVKNQGEIYKWLQLMWKPLIPIPVPIIPFDTYSDFYGATSRWFGDPQELPNILVDLERKIQETHGIGYEFWTIPLPGPQTFLEEHHYLTGCDASSLKNWITNICDKSRPTIFGWILFAGSVTYLVSGDIFESHCSIDVSPRIAFIPNNFPFVSVDEIGRVVLEPLPVNKVVIPDIRSWKQPVPSALFADDLEDSKLAKLPSLKITGYLGQEPQPRRYGSPFRARGLTVIDMSKSEKFLEAAPPVITELSPLFCGITSAPVGLNDTEEIRVVELECNVLSIPRFPQHFSIILIDVACSLNQSKTVKLTPVNEHVA
ncbi:MAG: hypothetical protein DDT32_01592 [Syntrophomonadaceae bacterium]|nr:hypothetical protein [Bacillota bacterium]MBT9147826.1 hypothetical protein [Bacillota bacterium]